MKKTLLLTLSFSFFLLSSTAAALLTSPQSFKGAITEDTDVFFIGKTIINGSFSGQPIRQMVNSSFVEEMGGFPLIGNCMIPNLHTVIVAENIDISRINTLEDFITQNLDDITSFSDVDIITDAGLFLLGIDNGTMDLFAELPYAVTTVVPLEIIAGTTTRFFVVGTNHPLTLKCSGGFSILSTLSDTSTLSVRDKDGMIIWTSESPNDYILIQDASFVLTNYQSLSLYPLYGTSSTIPLTVSVSPAAADDVQIQPLIQDVTDVLGNFNEDMRSGFVQSVNELDEVL